MPDLTVAALLGCPAWCTARHDRDLADPTLTGTLLHDTTAGVVGHVTVDVTATDTRPAGVDVDVRHASTTLTPYQARALAAVLTTAATIADNTGTHHTRRNH